MIKTKELIEEYATFLEKYPFKKILDLGCGSGRISLRFAKKGANVTSVDSKDIKVSDKNFEFIKKDIREFEFKEKYDLIISSLILHFFKKEKAIGVIKRMKENTSNGGFNFLICLTDKDDCSKEKPENFYPNLDSLKALYDEWEIVKQVQDFTEMENHNNLGEHRYNIIFLIVKKSGTRQHCVLLP